MSDIFCLMLAQLNPTVGDIAGNLAKARSAWEAGRTQGADMVALTEMFVTGYQTQDLILKPAFVTAAIAAVETLAAACADGPALGIGGPVRDGGRLYNGYYVLDGGRVHARVLKHHLLRPMCMVPMWSRASGSARRSARMPGIPMWQKPWPKPGQRSF
jgi:NAD+ synthase